MLSSREPVPPSPVPYAAIALSLMLLAGCGGGDGIILPGDGEAAAIAILRGDDQLGRVGKPLVSPLVVQVTDSRGRPVEGATVAFDFSSAGAGAAVVPGKKTTDGDGLAAAQLVLGTSIGRQTGQARLVLAEGRGPVQTSFSAMALPENANTMAPAAGQDQTGHVGLPLDDRLVVEVTDGFGNPVAGVPITWAALGGGSVSETVVETDEDGRSRVDRILGPTVGQQSTEASSEGLAGSPVTFLHTALAGDASRLVIISGNDQSARAGSILPDELVVQLIDADGNGVPQTAVSWVVATGGGAATPEISTTDSDGRTSARWTLGSTLGQQRIDAVVSGVGIASFRATAAAVAPPSLFIRTQPSATARNGVPLTRQPVLQLRDPLGSDVAQAGVQVTAAIGSGGGELGGTRQVSTDASGQATFTDLSISGAPGPRTLIFTASGYAQVASNEIDLEAIGTATTITGDSPDPSGVGTAFTVTFQVTSQGPTPTGSVTVGDGVQSCTGPLASGAGSCQLTLTTPGNRTLTASYAGGPGLTGSSDTESHNVTEAPPPPPAATTTTITDDSPDPTVSGARFTVRFTVTSSGPTPTGSVTVTVSDGTPTCTGTLSGGAGSCELTLNSVGDRTLTATYSGGPGLAGSSDTEPHRVDAEPPRNREPSADFSWHCEDLTCQFTDASSDRDGSVTNRHWDFGDGTSTENELNPSHTYTAPGDYRVVLTVTDNGGLTDDASDTVDPEAPPPQTLRIREQPSGSATVGEVFNRQPEIELRLGSGDLERAGITVSASIGSGSGALGGTTTATTDGNGRARFTNLSISGGTGPHTLIFSADGFGSVTSNSIEVRKADSETRITSHEPEPSIPGQTVTVVFSVTGSGATPTGTVTVTGENVAEPCTTPLSNGSGSCNITFTAQGDNGITASYNGDERFEASNDGARHEVDAAPPANLPPTAVDDPVTTDAGSAVTINVLANDNDPEGAPLTISALSQPLNGSTENNGDGTITYTPNAGFGGADDPFTYSASDGSLSDEATVTVTVNPPPLPDPGPVGLRTP